MFVEPGTWGGIHSHYSQYPLGLLCQQSDQASMWASLHFILTEVKNVFFHPSSFAFPSHSIFNYMYYCIVSLFPFSALTFTWPIFVSRFWLNSILNICGYGMVPIAMYSNRWMVVFLDLEPLKHSIAERTMAKRYFSSYPGNCAWVTFSFLICDQLRKSAVVPDTLIRHSTDGREN